MSNRAEFGRLSGRPFDEFNCFHIRDFESRDCIRVRSGGGELIKGIVTSIDLEANVIRYFTAANSDCAVTINDIVSLQGHESGWLD